MAAAGREGERAFAAAVVVLKGSRFALQAETVRLCVLLPGGRWLQALVAKGPLLRRTGPLLAAGTAAFARALALPPGVCGWSCAPPPSSLSPPPPAAAAAEHLPCKLTASTRPPTGSPAADVSTASLLPGADLTSLPADTDPALPTAGSSPSEASTCSSLLVAMTWMF